MNHLNFIRLVSRTRTFSGNQNKYVGKLQQLARRSTSATMPLQKMKEKEVSYYDTLPAIIDNLMASPKISPLPEMGSWVKKVLEHNITRGQHSIGLWTVMTYEIMEKPENITEEYLKLSRVLRWCVDMTRGASCIADDIMDGSTTREGYPCWYRMPNVGMSAVNDAVLLSCCVTETIETYFMKTPHYVDILRLFHEAISDLTMGQHMDFTTGSGTKPDYSLFTMERYNTIVKYKTSFLKRLSILSGLTLVKYVDKWMYANVDDITFKLGKLYQIRDDYMDCYGDQALTGKVATDIQERKCTWMAVTALQLTNPEQKYIFTKHYGSKEPEEVAIIKRLYNELQIPELYKQKEKEIHDDIVSRVRALPEPASKLFSKLLDQLYKTNH